jgi:alcohol dehydrogenase class IV
MAQLDRFRTPTEVQFGRGVVSQAGAVARRFAKRRVFLVTDRGVVAAGLLEPVIESLKSAGLDYDIFDGVEPNPSVTTVNNGIAAFRASGAEALIAVGGGSSIDAAKAISILATNDGDIRSFEGADKVTHPNAPLVAIPTTAGTASEITIFFVITDRDTKYKFSGGSVNATARVALLDPDLTVRMPLRLTAAVGMDTLTHAIEAYTCKVAYPVTSALAFDAIARTARYLPRAVADGTDIDAREQMLMACLMAGIAFSNSRLGNVHAMSHPVGGHFDVPHGIANAIILPYVMAYNLDAASDLYANVASALGCDVAGVESREAAVMAVEAVRSLNRQLGIPERLSEVGVTRAAIPAMATDAMKSGNIPINPRPTTYDDMVGLYEDVV